MTDIDLGVLTLMVGPLVAVVCCAACLRSYFHFMNRRLRDKTDADVNESNHVQQWCHTPKRTQTGPIDHDEEEEKCKDVIRKTRVEKMMGRFQFGVCVEVDGHPFMENFNDDIETIKTPHVERILGPQEQLPEDETDLPNEDSMIHDDCCAICLERYSAGDILCTAKRDNCSHVFHRDCMVQWIRRHNRCPICRTNLMRDVSRMDIV